VTCSDCVILRKSSDIYFIEYWWVSELVYIVKKRKIQPVQESNLDSPCRSIVTELNHLPQLILEFGDDVFSKCASDEFAELVGYDSHLLCIQICCH
jgi:hypothetical protein